jgi:hypothetical protein
MMKNVILAAAIAVTASSSFAGSLAEPIMEVPVIMEEASSASSSSGLLIPLLLIAILAAAMSSSGGNNVMR